MQAGRRVEARKGECGSYPPPDAIPAAVVIDPMRANRQQPHNRQRAPREQQRREPAAQIATGSEIDEETNASKEKGTIASVYLNRITKGMPLQADPTIRFALNDFTIKRVYGDHLKVASSYNTYQNTGLPPGPICTPSKKTIDAVLDSPSTNYLYFVADSSFNGTHSFSVTYTEHMQKARAYQKAFQKRFGGK
jgi:UPF0755 protein